LKGIAVKVTKYLAGVILVVLKRMNKQEISTEKVEWGDIFSLVIPVTWKFHEEDGVISLFDVSNGVGAIQLSLSKRQTPQEPIDQEAIEFAQDFASQHKCHIEVGSIHSFDIGGCPASEFSFEENNEEPEYWRIWHIMGRERMAFITYNCSVLDRDVEKQFCNQIVISFEWL
jgi:hypothetical protein